MDTSNPNAEYIMTRGNRIIKTGMLQDIEMEMEDTEYINCNGAVAIPGFNDAHLHLSTVGANIYDCNLEGVKSIEELINRVKEYIKSNNIPEDQWVLGKGWNQDYFEISKLPSKSDLNKISEKHKICLIRGCYHMCVINSKAASALNITPEMKIDGGQFDIDDKTREVTGICRENAMKFVLENLPPITVEKFKEYVRKAQDYLLSLGVTSAQTDDFMLAGVKWQDVMKAYSEMVKDGELKIRVFEQCLLPRLAVLKDFLASGYKTGYEEGKFKVVILKLLADGNFGNRTAALNEPFKDFPDNFGIMNYTQAELDELFSTAYKGGLRIGVHCIGDRSSEMVLEAESRTRHLYGSDTRMNMIHCQMANEKILKEMKRLETVGNIQPAFLDYDIHMVESRLGKERLNMTYNWRTMLDRGIILAMGTDSPITIPNPFMGIYCAVTRQDFEGFPEGGWYPEERLTVEEAIEAYTFGSAYASFEESELGRLKPNMLADITFIDKDPYNCKAEDLLKIKVLRTVVDGEIAYERKELI